MLCAAQLPLLLLLLLCLFVVEVHSLAVESAMQAAAVQAVWIVNSSAWLILPA
jgi:hypothetical protein